MKTMVRVRACAAVALAVAVATAGAADVTGRLDVAGGMLVGDLAPVPEIPGSARETFLWSSARFTAPFEFRIGEVAGIAFPGRPRRPAAPGPFVHLRGGDVLAGTIESLDDETLVMSLAGSAGPQRLRIARREVAAITRTNAGSAAYDGPSGLDGWEQSPPASWREDVGRIIADRPGATVTRNVSAPERARFEIRLSRGRAAEFRVAVAAAERPADDGYVLQAVGGDAAGALMLVRRSGGRAAIEPAPDDAWRGDTLRVVLFVDQSRGRLAAVFPDAQGDGKAAVIETTLRPAGAARLSGRFRLELSGGEICLEQLRVGPWLGDEPTLRDAGSTTVTSRAGVLDGFSVSSFDAAAGTYLLERAGETRQVPAADVDEVRFPDEDAAAFEPTLRAICTDGVTLSGDLVKVDETTVWLRRRGVAEPVAVPRAALTTLRVLRAMPRRGDPGGRVGTLAAGDDRVRGWLADGGADGLAWWPLGSVNAAAFAGRVDAEVEYVERKPGRPNVDGEIGGIGGLVSRDDAGFFAVAMLTDDGAAARDGRLHPGDRIVAISPTPTARFVETQDLDNETVTHLLRGRIGTVVRMKVTDATGANPRQIDLARGTISVGGPELLQAALQAHARLAGAGDGEVDPREQYPSLIILRSGDQVRCRVEAIDGETIMLRAPPPVGAGPVRVPAGLVKALELIPTAASRIVDKTLRDRLLTVPRMQRDRPPTHLLRLVDGDYLRGRLLKVDERTVTFELLDVAKQLPRGQVARIIWLHPDTVRPDGEAPEEPEAAEAGLVAQGVTVDDRRMTLLADTVKGNVLQGRSRAFGDSGIDLTQIDRLLLGTAVERDTGELLYSQWTLKPAPEPRALTAPGGE